MAVQTTPISDSLKQILASTVYSVEATDYEVYSLWNMYSSDSEVTFSGIPKVDFKSDLRGYTVTIGDLYGNPIAISLSFMELNGKTILFYCPISETVSYTFINKWLSDNCQAYKDGKTTDPINFMTLIEDIK